MSAVELEPVKSFWGRVRFANVARRIQGGDPNWVPTLLPEMLKTLNEKKNPFFEHAQAQSWIARRNGKIVGRITANVDRLHDETHQEKCGFFGYFESIDDVQIARALLDTACAWLREKGATKIRGPINLSTNNECGLLVDGFNTPPAILSLHNPPYYRKLIEGYGFASVKELLAYEVTQASMGALEKLRRVAQHVKERGRFEVRPIRMDRFEEEVATIGRLFNEAWAANWGFVPVTEAELRFTAKGLKPIIDPRLVLFAEVDGEPVGFIVPLPDVNVAIKKINGRLFPFGIFRLFFLLKNIHSLRLPLFGVIPKYRAAGVEGVLLLEMIDRGLGNGYPTCECSWVLEDNLPMRRALEGLGGKIVKRYKIYEKAL